MSTTNPASQLRHVISAEQIQKRIKEMARQISDDYRGRSVHAYAVLENSFMFVADLVREMDVPVVCNFIKPKYRTQESPGSAPTLEILFTDELNIRDQHVLLVEGIVNSGVTSEFLMSDLRSHGAASVKLATLLDRQCARRVPLQPDYFGFLVEEGFIVGYGLSDAQQMGRNLPYLASNP